MSTIFKHIERKVYPNTFLQQVDVRLQYPILKRDCVLEGDVESFFKNHFDLEKKANDVFDGNVFLKDDQQQIAFLFSDQASMVSVGHLNYRSFYDSVLPNVYHIKDFVFNLLRQENVNAFIRKVNVFTFENNVDISEEEFYAILYDNVFSQEFLKVVPKMEDSKIDGKSISIQKRMMEDVLFRSYIVPRENKSYSLFLETVLRNNVDRLNLEERLESMNSVLYNAFHWSVGANIISIMNKEGEQ